MERFLDQDWLTDQLHRTLQWVLDHVVNWGTAGQLAAVLVALAIAWAAGRKIETRYRGWVADREGRSRLRRVGGRLIGLTQPVIWLLLASVVLAGAAGLDWPRQILTLAVNLIAAWVVIRLTTYLIGASAWTRRLAVVIWVAAALNFLDLLQPTFDVLEGAALQVGELRLSALSVITGMVTLTVLVWLALAASRLAERRISGISELTPSVQLLLSNLFRITLLTIAIIAGLGAVGIDLTAFAVFGGALGVGVGFGLQKVVSNFVSGIILLLDRSVKPGDVIVIGETFGWVNSLGARFTSVITRDGAEHLIPNEDLITQRVENWSHTDQLVRLKVPIGISYDSDVRAAMDMLLEAAAETGRVLEAPAPTCLVRGFGDSSVDLELRFWIRDPASGVSNVKSRILLAVWDKFHAGGIEIPYPQLDLHVKRPRATGTDRLDP
ncbi:MAG: mechanosensitive ion channel [Alphaproteobacteria bacterium]|nr:mechanosensitive ion channel [Alphaproteobacteria bacterium]MCZ6763867.1 mechanosensitive ion channel [Alphaproteobacteria bacterium]